MHIECSSKLARVQVGDVYGHLPMGSLPNHQHSALPKKPVTRESFETDKYGRKRDSLPEKLRAQTDYERDTGYSPMYHAALADLPRLASGAVCYAFVLVVNMLSLGRQRAKSSDRRHEWTLPISTAELSEYCRANERDIQRQLAEMEVRGMIGVRRVKQGGLKYSISLRYAAWQALDDYAVWKRKQVVSIDEAPEVEPEDEDVAAVDVDAVKLTKRPQTVKPGRAARAIKVGVGVAELVLQNDSPQAEASFTAVVDAGRMVVSARFEGAVKSTVPTECRVAADTVALPLHPLEKRAHPRSMEIGAIFDPILARDGARLLSPDKHALYDACVALGETPAEVLGKFLHGPDGRATRRISGPRAVAAICRECRENWDFLNRSQEKQRVALCVCGEPVARGCEPYCRACKARWILEVPARDHDGGLNWDEQDMRWALNVRDEETRQGRW